MIKKIVFMLVLSCSLLLTTNEISAAQEVTVNNVNDLKVQAESASDDTTIKLGSTFPSQLSDVINLTINNDVAITIEKDGAIKELKAASTKKHFEIVNNSTKEFKFKNIKFVGDTLSSIRDIRTGGLKIFKGSFTIEDSEFDSNFMAIQSGSRLSSLKVNHSLFTKNYNTLGAGAICIENGSDNFDLNNSTFDSNQGSGYGYAGGAVWIKGSKNVYVKNSYFVNNRAGGTSGGGAIALTANGADGEIVLDQNSFKNNQADTFSDVYSQGSAWSDGGAIYIYSLGNEQEFSLTNSLFEENYAQDDGGALLLERIGNANANYDALTKIVNNTFIKNNANGKGIAAPVKNSGGAIQLSNKVNAVIEYNTIVLNNVGGVGESQASHGGGIGIYGDSTYSPRMQLTNNIILGNTITDDQGNISSSNDSNVEGDVTSNENNVGVDNGVLLPADVNMSAVFGTSMPTAQDNYSSLSVGYNDESLLKTIPIIPSGLASAKGKVISVTTDMRGYARTSKPDIGSVQAVSIKYHVNGGTWKNINSSAFDGSSYFDQNNPGEYYKIGYVNLNSTVLGSSNIGRTGYALKGWSNTLNGNLSNQMGSSITLSDNIELYALWKDSSANDESVKVSFIMNDPNKKLSNQIIEITKNKSFSQVNKAVPNPNTDNYKFLGWCYTNKKCSTSKQFTKNTVVTSDITLYAQWEKSDQISSIPKGGTDFPLAFIAILLGGSIYSINRLRKNNK